jgi:hypothetical protein
LAVKSLRKQAKHSWQLLLIVDEPDNVCDNANRYCLYETWSKAKVKATLHEALIASE